MGLPLAVIDLMMFEHAYRPITGDVGFIGRQTTFLTEAALAHLLARHNVTVPEGFAIEKDVETLSARSDDQHRLITDRCLIRALGGKYLSIDVSAYEGADLVMDMSFPVKKKYHNKFDFIYDGSCLDNIFNPAAALMNMSKMLRPGGRILILEHATNFNGPYIVFSPAWFFDFFAANRYRDCKVYLMAFADNNTLHAGGLPTFYYNWKEDMLGATPTVPPGTHLMNVVIAEKGPDSTSDAQPVQMQYRDRAYHEAEFSAAAREMLGCDRPLFGHSDMASTEKYIGCGLAGHDIPL